MQLKPNDVPEMVEGEVRRITCKLDGAVGVNSINAATASGNLTTGVVSINGTSISFLLTASQVGTHYMLVSATLSSSETVKGKFRVKVSSTECGSSNDY
jgi:hypothetical protein